jgi:hypothetical protein
MRPFIASKYIIKVHVYENLTNVKFFSKFVGTSFA